MRQDETLLWLLGDHLGSTAYTVTGTGETGETRYRAFGGTRFSSGNTPTGFRSTGQREESSLGLYFYNARWYDPALGHFLSADTLFPNPADTLDYHRYSYTRFNPLKYTDPTGHCAVNDDGSENWEGETNYQCWQTAYAIYGYGAGGFGAFQADWQISADQWLQNIAQQPFATTEYLQPFKEKYDHQFCVQTGSQCGNYVENPMGSQTFPLPTVNCSQVDCTTLLINNTIIGLDTVSLYAAGGAASAQTVAFACGAVGLLPCAAAAEGVAGTLGKVSTVASVVGTGLTAVQVARNKATAVDLAVSLTSTMLGSKGQEYFVNAGVAEEAAKVAGAATGLGASFLQYKYDTK